MAKTVDIGSKRLISLAPQAWSRWVTGDPLLESVEILSGDFQWVARANDALLKVRSPQDGEYLIANEIQFRPDLWMPLRLRVYTALGEERYHLRVFPVVINILPPAPGVQIATHYHSEFRGIVAHQDFRVINLWEIDAEQVFAQNLKTLLPFTPILKGGQQERLLQRAIIELRATPEIAEMEPLLAFFASFVLQTDVVRRLMRWDMTVLRESPWYNEILKEGLEQGYQQGMQQGIQEGMQQGMQQGREQAQVEILLHILRHRFGEISADLALQLRKLSSEQLGGLIDIGLDAQSLAEFLAAFQKTLPSQS